MEANRYLDIVYLDTVTGGKHLLWTVEIMVGEQPMMFKLNTGAEVTGISEQSYRMLKDVTMSKPSKVLYGASRSPLGVLGQFSQK